MAVEAFFVFDQEFGSKSPENCTEASYKRWFLESPLSWALERDSGSSCLSFIMITVVL